MTSEQFEVSTWADAEVTPGPGRDAELEQDQDENLEQGDEPADDEKSES